MRRLLPLAVLTMMAGCASAPAPRPSAAPAPMNHAPVVRARCEPCRVAVGGTLTVAADATDADRDGLSYSWTASSGTLATPAAAQSLFTAAQPGQIPVVVTVRDTRGGIASDTITVTVTR